MCKNPNMIIKDSQFAILANQCHNVNTNLTLLSDIQNNFVIHKFI